MDDTSAEPALDFANPAIDVSGLPPLGDHQFEPLDPAYVRLRTSIALAVAGAVALVTVVSALAGSSLVAVLVGSAALALVATVGAAHRIEVAHMGYLVREHDLSFRRGVIGRSVATIPFARVQHVSITRGPVERRYGLASLQLRTAGGEVSIPGLDTDFADRLKQLVADRAGALADAEIDTDAV